MSKPSKGQQLDNRIPTDKPLTYLVILEEPIIDVCTTAANSLLKNLYCHSAGIPLAGGNLCDVEAHASLAHDTKTVQ
jgi:hypothetical protein